MDWSCFHWLPLECSPAELLRMVCVGFFLYTRTLGQVRGRGLKSSVWPTCQAICPMLESVHPGKGCPFLICTKSPKRQKHYRRLVMLPWGLQSGFLASCLLTQLYPLCLSQIPLDSSLNSCSVLLSHITQIHILYFLPILICYYIMLSINLPLIFF